MQKPLPTTAIPALIVAQTATFQRTEVEEGEAAQAIVACGPDVLRLHTD